MAAANGLADTVRGALADRAPGEVLVVAASGGADSTALALLVPDPGRVVLAHVDHGIHAAREAAATFVARLAQHLGARFRRTTLALPPTEHDEASLRRHRYDALIAIAREVGSRTLLTAHHADDDLETLLLRLERGTGLRGLCGIPARRSLAPGLEVVRPLLGVRKATLAAFVAARGLHPIEDPTNQDTAKRRNHVRHVLLPALHREHGVALTANLFALLRSARATVATLAERTGALLRTHTRERAPGLLHLALAPALPRLLLLDLAGEIHKELASCHATTAWCERVATLATSPTRGAQVRGGSPVAVERSATGLVFLHLPTRGAPPPHPQGLDLDAPPVRFGTTPWFVALSLSPPRGPHCTLLLPRAVLPLAVRAPRPSDRLCLPSDPRPLPLSRIASAHGVPHLLRAHLPLLVTATDTPLALATLAAASPDPAPPDAPTTLQVHFELTQPPAPPSPPDT